MTRKIVHGNDNFGYATIKNESGTLSFNAPVMMPGMVSCSIEVDQSDDAIYADNIVWARPRGAKVRTAEVAFRYIDEAYMELLSFKKAGNGLYTDTNTAQPHAFFFEETVEDSDTGEITKTLHIIYNATGGEPSVETETDEDGVEARELSIEYSCNPSSFVVDENGNYVQYAFITRTAENATFYDTFKQSILLPTDSGE